MQPSPVVTLNRAVAVGKARGPAEALAMIEPLAPQLGGYFYFFGARGAFLLQLGRAAEAREAFNRAIPLPNTAPAAAHIRRALARLTQDTTAIQPRHRTRRRHPGGPPFPPWGGPDT